MQSQGFNRLSVRVLSVGNSESLNRKIIMSVVFFTYLGAVFTPLLQVIIESGFFSVFVNMALISKSFCLKYLLTPLLNYDKMTLVMKGRNQSIV